MFAAEEFLSFTLHFSDERIHLLQTSIAVSLDVLLGRVHGLFHALLRALRGSSKGFLHLVINIVQRIDERIFRIQRRSIDALQISNPSVVGVVTKVADSLVGDIVSVLLEVTTLLVELRVGIMFQRTTGQLRN